MSERTVRAVRLENWHTFKDAYDAPELTPRIVGTRPDGETILTSRIAKARGRIITTESGSVYELGTILADFRGWLRAQGLKYDPNHPIRIRAQPRKGRRR